MEADLRRHLLTASAAYADATGKAMTTIGRKAAGDWRFFDRLQEETSFTIRIYDKVMAWFSQNWPTEVDWPSDVPRPLAEEEAA